MKRIVAATDRTHSADRACQVAASISGPIGADLVLLQVILASDSPDQDRAKAEAARHDLEAFAERLAGPRGTARVAIREDAAQGIVDEARDADADLLVVGNYGMAGRKQFLLKNVPNRISHMARCSVLIVNTTPVDEAETVVALGERTEQEPHAGKLLGRAVTIARTMSRHGVREMFTPVDPKDEDELRRRAKRLRTAMEELGPAFGKLGQVMSTRPDLLPAPFVEELSTLQSDVPPLTEAQVVQVMEEELGVPWEDVFESIEPEPLAAGTMAQVHGATLQDGEDVVVKVQRPNARHDILLDLGLLERFGQEIHERPLFREVVDLPAVIEQLSEALRQEMDFRQEADNIERLAEVLKPYPRLAVPKLFRDYCTDRLLVMERVKGTRLREAPEGQARREAARQLLESYYRQIMTAGFFHADPHPGNLQWWNDKVYLLDIGLVGRLEPETREQLMLLLLAFWQEDVPFLSDVVLMLSGDEARPDLDVEAFQDELSGLLGRYRGKSLKEIQIGPLLQELTEISVRYRIRLPSSLTLTGKALAQVQLAISELDPTIDPFSVAGNFMMKSMAGDLREKLSPQKLIYEGRKLGLRVSRLIEAVERIAGSRPGPNLQIRFRGAEPLERAIKQGARQLALAIVSLAALAGAAVAGGATNVPDWVAPAFGGAGGITTVALIVDLIRSARR